MSDPFVGEIRMFAGNFAPRGWALCDGQLLAISQNDALFSLLGTIYGGDGRTTFGLPDLRGRIPVHMGSGPGLSTRRLGSKGGAETHTLTVNQLPSHNHAVIAANQSGNNLGENPNKFAASQHKNVYKTNTTGELNLAGNSITDTGGVQSHPNIMPFQCVHYIIALVGIFPSRN
ncbi:MAG: tail fiber protein [Bacteroidota bacterium]